jgi:Ni/Fe-hydrogenase subunit HybB-like protein
MMRDADIRERLARHAVSGRYDLFLGVGTGLLVLGLILFFFWGLTGAATDRAWQLFLVNWVFFTGLSAGSVAFAAAQKITNAHWSGVVIRFAEASAAFFPVSLLGLILIFTAGYHHIFGAMEAQLPGMSPGKQLWLSQSFMFTRMLVGVGVLFFFGWKLVQADIQPDLVAALPAVSGARRNAFERRAASYDPSDIGAALHNVKLRRLAPTYAVLYAIVMTWVAFDMIMALQPHWYSTLFGAYYFMASFLGGLMLLALMTNYGRRHLGLADLVSPKQRHDLGKLCFGFTVFWAYLMWSQFLVIWYGNIPEETGFVFSRLWGDWLPIGRLVFIGLFLVPFIGLLGVKPKKSPMALSIFAAVSLCALWLERYLLVMPSVNGRAGPQFGLAEIGATAMFAGAFLLVYALFARSFPMVSPRLAMITLEREVAHHHHAVADIYDHEEATADFVSDGDVEKDLGH